MGPISWEGFKVPFLDQFFLLELREAKMQGFILLKQDNMSVREYSLNVTNFWKYAPFMIVDPRTRISKFIF